SRGQPARQDDPRPDRLRLEQGAREQGAPDRHSRRQGAGLHGHTRRARRRQAGRERAQREGVRGLARQARDLRAPDHAADAPDDEPRREDPGTLRRARQGSVSCGGRKSPGRGHHHPGQRPRHHLDRRVREDRQGDAKGRVPEDLLLPAPGEGVPLRLDQDRGLMSDPAPDRAARGLLSTPAMARRVLVVDDDRAIRDTLRMILEYEGYEVATAADGKAALSTIENERADAVLLDIKMPGMDGMETLDRIVEKENAPPVLMISGHGDIATAVEATRRGAADFLEKPPERERILVSLKNALSRNTLAAENERLRLKLEEESVLVGKSEPMQKLRAQVARAAPTAATVLIVGESGTGKELVAREIHKGSRVAGGPFIQVNCAAIPEELIESEL